MTHGLKAQPNEVFQLEIPTAKYNLPPTLENSVSRLRAIMEGHPHKAQADPEVISNNKKHEQTKMSGPLWFLIKELRKKCKIFTSHKTNKVGIFFSFFRQIANAIGKLVKNTKIYRAIQSVTMKRFWSLHSKIQLHHLKLPFRELSKLTKVNSFLDACIFNINVASKADSQKH